jgi:acetoin utilization deacetylase AcuC-like enzyme
MGFCLFNNAAIAAARALAELGAERVLILDWDVHAGNGTAEIFRRRNDVLFVCLHEHGLYPGTGQLTDAGAGDGDGYTINLPVPAGSGEGLWLALLQELVLPAVHAFAPDLILVSCGFDAHRSDPLARCRLRTESYAHMAALVAGAARELDVPVGLLQEGGYDSAVLAECVCAVLPALGGVPVEGEPEPPPGGGPELDMLERARAELASRAAL